MQEINPDVVICIDALAAREAERLNTTIQVCDTGITPGAGVGNRRLSLNEETLGVPVIAVGVPTVISMPAMISHAMEGLLENYRYRSFGNMRKKLLNLSRRRRYPPCL